MTILPIALFSLTLAWLAPVTNEDASTLTDLAGFKLYQASTEALRDTQLIGTMTNRVNATPQRGEEYRMQVSIQERAAWFAVTAFDLSGNESAFSVPVSWKYIWQNAYKPAVNGTRFEGNDQ